MPAVAHDSGLDNPLCLLLAAFCVWAIKSGLSTGKIGIGWGTWRRSEDAPIFWFIVGLYVIFTMLSIGAFFGMGPWK